MKWYFVNTRTLTDTDTGFTIRLLFGTWSNPVEIKPDKSTVSIYEQTRLLRKGLQYAKEAYMEKSRNSIRINGHHTEINNENKTRTTIQEYHSMITDILLI